MVKTKLHTLAEKITSAIERKRKEEKDLCEEINISFDGYCEDVTIDVGEDMVTLTYDGDGFHHLSMESDIPFLLHDMGVAVANWDGPALRKTVIAIAEDLGFCAEDINSWSLGFYPKN